MVYRMRKIIIAVVITISFLMMVAAWSTSEAADDRDEFKRALLKDAVIKETGGIAGEGSKVSINFKNAPMSDVVLSLSRQAGKGIVIDKSIDAAKVKVTCFYDGTSFEEALDSIVSGLDYSYRAVGDGTYLITEYEEVLLNVHDIYVKHKEDSNTTQSSTSNTSLSSSSMSGSRSSGTGSTGGGTLGSTTSSGSGNGKTSSEHSEREITRIVEYIQKMLSSKGVITQMSAGFIYVRDIPSRIKMVKAMVKMDDSKRKTIMMKISLLRIDYKDEYESGINWWALLKQSTSPRIEVGANFMGGGTLGAATTNVATLTLTQGDLTAVIKALETYADVNVVQSWETRAVSGAVLPFHLYQTIWYSTGSIVQVVNNQTITTPQMESMEVGLKMTVNPMKMDKSYLVNTSIDLSNLLGFQTVGNLDMPNIERNYVSVPIKMSTGETVAISGFKIKAIDKKRVGIPLLIKIPLLSYIFGYDKASDRTSELTVIITFNGELEV